MRRISSEQCNIAWFRLAECVSRGEQERAFAVYRLLSHSIDDQALVQQLAGDLFLSFNDEQMALEKYERAADMYQQEGRVHSAVAVYNHMLTIDPSLPIHRPYLARLHDRLGALQKKDEKPTKTESKRDVVFTAMLSDRDWQAAAAQLSQAAPEDRVGRYRSLIVAMLSHEETPAEDAQVYIKQLLDMLVASNAVKEMKQFFAELKAIDSESYQYARDYAKNPSTRKASDEATGEEVGLSKKGKK